MENKLKVLLVDDETLLIESLEIILSMTASMDIVGKANDGKQALKILENAKADIALVDLNMKGMGGIELISILKEKYPELKILVLTTFYDEDNITNAIRNGANGYILKDSGRNAIISAIENVMNGQSVLDEKVMNKISQIISNKPINETGSNKCDFLKDLTKRELEICTMISEGYTNSQIAKFLYISEGTVKNYISSIYDKTNIHDRALLAVRLRNLKL